MLLSWHWFAGVAVAWCVARALTPPLWMGYSIDELRAARDVDRANLPGFLVAGAGCCALAAAAAAVAPSDIDVELTPRAADPAIANSAALLWIAAMVPLLTHVMATPPFDQGAEPHMLRVTRALGHWVFLTRWVITLQAGHASLSLYGELHGGAIRHASYAASTIVAAAATYVTVQYYTLAATHPTTREAHRKWGTRGNYNMNLLAAVTHLPGMLIGLADLFLVKESAFVAQTRPPVSGLSSVICGFVVTYLTSICINRWIVNAWPYRVMDSIESPLAFLIFAGGQVLVLCGFAAILVGMQYVALAEQ